MAAEPAAPTTAAPASLSRSRRDDLFCLPSPLADLPSRASSRCCCSATTALSWAISSPFPMSSRVFAKVIPSLSLAEELLDLGVDRRQSCGPSRRQLGSRHSLCIRQL